jgi:nucleotide-binding universal stress UspA family protein
MVDAVFASITMPTIRHILFPYDCSAQGLTVVPYVRALAQRFDARVTIFGVVPPTFATVAPEAALHLRAGADTAEWKRHLQCELDRAFVNELAGIAVDRVAEVGDPAIRIVDHAHQQHVDLIAMPTHGAGTFRGFLIGSVTAKVLHDARCAVWTAAHADAQTAAALPARILCAVDGSKATPALVRWTAEFAEAVGARLDFVHVVGPVSDWPALESERHLQDQVREAASQKIEAMSSAFGADTRLTVAVGNIVQTVAEEARQSIADLVVIGRGSVSEPFGRLRTHAFGIIQRSPCPVLSV